MRKNITSIMVATVALAFSAIVSAEVDLSGNVALTSDYTFRGISQTDEDPAVQGGFDLAHSSGFYAGVWASNVDFDDGDEAHIEMDVYGGISGEFPNALGWDVGILHYDYPGADSSLDYDFNEIYGSLSYDFGPVAASAGISYSNDYFGGSDNATYYSLDLSVPLPQDFSIGAHVGRQEIDENNTFGTPDYTDWKLGVSKEIGGFGLALDYVDTDLSDSDCFGGSDLCDGRVVFTVSKSL